MHGRFGMGSQMRPSPGYHLPCHPSSSSALSVTGIAFWATLPSPKGESFFFFFLKKRLQLEMSIHKRIEWELLVFAQSICFLSIPGCLFEKLPCRVSASVRIWKEEDWDARALLVSSRIICVHGKCRNPMQSLLFSVGLFDVPEIDGLCCWLNVDRISFSTLHSHNLVSRFPF